MNPDALAPLLALQNAPSVTAATSLAIDAIEAGATAEEANRALNEWYGLQAAQVQQLFADRPRRDCCTGIERHQPVRCLCGGLKGQHGTDRRGRPTCFHSPMCACTTHRPASAEGSIDRHPAGKAREDKQ